MAILSQLYRRALEARRRLGYLGVSLGGVVARMGGRNKQGMYFNGKSRPAQVDEGVQVHGYERDHPWKRKRPERIDQSPPYNLPNVDVHGLIFAVLAVVFVVYPIAQYFLGL